MKTQLENEIAALNSQMEKAGEDESLAGHLLWLRDQAEAELAALPAEPSELAAEIARLEKQIEKAWSSAFYGTKVFVAPGSYTAEEVAEIRAQNQALKREACAAAEAAMRPAKIRLAALKARLATAELGKDADEDQAGEEKPAELALELASEPEPCELSELAAELAAEPDESEESPYSCREEWLGLYA